MSWQDIIKDDDYTKWMDKYIRESEKRRGADENQQYPETESDELSKLLDDLENNYYDLSQLSAYGEIGTDAPEALLKAIQILRPGFEK